MKNIVSARLTVPFWCSFRMPYTINVNFSYPVPPPVTLFGFIGCAMGIPADTFDLMSSVAISVGLEQEGESIETYSRIIKRDPRIPDRRTLLIRQKLHQPVYRFYLMADEDLAAEVATSLADPVFPLALGESDDMVEVDQIAVYPAIPGEAQGIDSILPTDLGVKPVSACTSAYLPIAFKRGKRDWTGVDYRTYYIATHLVLDQPIKSYAVGEKQVVF